MSRKFVSSVFAACIGIALLAAAPLAVSASAPHDLGVTATEPIKHETAAPEVAAIIPAVPGLRDAERVRPSVAVYNLRTCTMRKPDASGRLVPVASHRTYAVPWVKCPT